MIRSKIAAVTFGAALGLGALAVPATADPSSSSSSSTETHTAVPGGGPTQIVLAGIGTLTLEVDATTGAVSNVGLVPLDGVVLDSIVVTPTGAIVNVTLADGTTQQVKVEGELEHGVPEVETEVEGPEDEQESESEHTTGDDSSGDSHSGDSSSDSGGDSSGHGGGDSSGHGGGDD